jgi:hypothetical protein
MVLFFGDAKIIFFAHLPNGYSVNARFMPTNDGFITVNAMFYNFPQNFSG